MKLMNSSDSTTYLLAHKIRLYKLTRSQLAYFHRACGTRRWAFNRCVQDGPWDIEEGKAPSHFTINNWLNAQKQNDPDLAWLYEVGSRITLGAAEAYARACDNYVRERGRWRREQERDGKPDKGKPKVKRKYRSDMSFLAAIGDACKVELAGQKNQRSRIKIPRLGWVKGREPLRFDGTIKRITITKDSSGHWYAVILVDVPWTHPLRETQAMGGVDKGLKTLAVDSDGVEYKAPKAKYRKLQRARRKWEQARSRRQPAKGEKPSSGYLKACAKVARLYGKAADMRATITHRVSHELVHKYTMLGIEDLNVKGMMAKGGSRKRGLNRGIAEASWATLRRQLEYKGELYGCEVIPISQWYPSSLRCSYCGLKMDKDELTLGDRTITCESCGQTYDRDVNAAINIRREAMRMIEDDLGRTTPEAEVAAEAMPVERIHLPVAKSTDRETLGNRNPVRIGGQPIQLSLL